MKTQNLETLAEELGNLLIERRLFFKSAESCTGGWVGQTVTAVAGSSRWYGAGFITYSNTAKNKILEVSKETLKKYGAVSEEVVQEMVAGALQKSGAALGIAISGIAGPGGGTKKRPVGTVCIAWKLHDNILVSSTELFDGDRNQVRYATVEHTFKKAIELIKEN